MITTKCHSVLVARALCLFGTVTALGLVAAPLAASTDVPKPDALIGGGEDIDDHEGEYESLDDHEGDSEALASHHGQTEDIHDHEGKTEDLDDHHGESGSLEGRSVQSERLFGMENDPELALSAAREKLLNARQRHRREVFHAEAEIATPSDTDLGDHGSWSHRLEVAKHRILLAEAGLEIYDRAYADMIRDDYPRGDARQDLVDSKDRAQERLEAERAILPKLVERARAAGVSQAVLYDYERRD